MYFDFEVASIEHLKTCVGHPTSVKGFVVVLLSYNKRIMKEESFYLKERQFIVEFI